MKTMKLQWSPIKLIHFNTKVGWFSLANTGMQHKQRCFYWLEQ